MATGTTPGDHKTLIASLAADQRKQLTRRSNFRAIIPLLLHFGMIFFFWWLILQQVPGWQLMILPLGILMVFLFTLLHETCHRTPFRSRSINIALSWVCAVVVVLPPNWFRHFHFEHHRYTQDPDRDPELQSPKPATFVQYIWHITGIPVWCSHIKTLIVNASGNCKDSFVPDSAARTVHYESVVILSVYLSIILIAVISGFINVVLLWIIALLAGQPFLRLYLMAEHGRCPFVANMFANTRTTLTNKLVRTIAWNMPYHAEHHAYPSVPYYNLPLLHRLAEDRLLVVADGYMDFHRAVLGELREGRRESANYKG